MNSGGELAPLGARGASGPTLPPDDSATRGVRGPAPAREPPPLASAGATPGASPRELPLSHSLWSLVVILTLSLLAYATLATDLVHTGPLSSHDNDVSSWVARSMPTWAEWLARPFSWVGGLVGITVIVTLVVARHVWSGEHRLALLVAVVTTGSQLLSTFAKAGYDRLLTAALFDRRRRR